jgi:DNA ligase-1
MEWPILYTLTGNQNIRYWKVGVTQDDTNGVHICREYGKYQGKPIVNKKLITESRSKKTVYDQAVFEAGNDWQEMIDKKGYVSDMEQLTNTSGQLTPAPASVPAPVSAPICTSASVKKVKISVKPQMTTDALRSFKFLPMLANKWIERKKYVTYPCVAQPKLDGVRYTARRMSATQVLLKTRNDAECPFFDEIKMAISGLELPPNVFLDGEFYSKRLPFRTLNGYCNRKKLDGKTGYNTIPKEDITNIQYNIFDCYFIDEPGKPFDQRYQFLSALLSENKNNYLQLVPILPINDESEIIPVHDKFVLEGYEGIIIRNSQSPYKLKDRSNDLLKYKNFHDTEFEIVGAKAPTNGKEENCIIWELKLPDSELTFSCRPRDTYASRKADWLEYNEHPSHFIGLPYTVRFQETYENGIPRFPSGIAIRNDI